MDAPYLYKPADLPEGDYSRIISLVPSLTETMVGLGLADRLVGRTKFCTSSPEALADVPIIGGTKNPSISTILALEPDLVLTVKEENRMIDAASLGHKVPVVVFDIQTVGDVPVLLEDMGRIFQLPYARFEHYAQEIRNLLNVPPEPHPKVAYLIWKEPWMTVGSDTYIGDMLRHCGFALPDPSLTRYPSIDLPAFVKEHVVEAVFLSSEPFPFKDSHVEELAQQLEIPVQLIDGQLMSWYGTLTPAGLRYGREMQEGLV